MSIFFIITEAEFSVYCNGNNSKFAFLTTGLHDEISDGRRLYSRHNLVSQQCCLPFAVPLTKLNVSKFFFSRFGVCIS